MPVIERDDCGGCWEERQPGCPVPRILAENKRLREGLEEIAANRHGFARPAGAIARAALAGKPLPRRS